MSKKEPPRVLFFVEELKVGGAQRVCLLYVNHLKVIQPLMLLMQREGELLREVNPQIPVIDLSALCPNLPLPFLLKGISLLRQAYTLQRLTVRENCAIVSSFDRPANFIAVLAKILFARHLRVVISEHTVTSDYLKHSDLGLAGRSIHRILTRITYPRADLIVAVSQGVQRDLIENFGIPEERIVVQHNPIDIERVRTCAREHVVHPRLLNLDVPLVVAVGRLDKIKGFDFLVQAFAELLKKVDSKLVIIGEGEERSSLCKMIQELGLQENVTLLGYQGNPWKYMVRADVFVLSSLVEGFPNVIGEALALSLPVLAVDCSPGVREYLQEGKCGVLVPRDLTALAKGLEHLLTDDNLRKRLARQAGRRVSDFDLPRVVQSYESIIRSIASKP